MYNKNVKKTFEILRSEITYLMDLHMYAVNDFNESMFENENITE